jgi:hypothetical protein
MVYAIWTCRPDVIQRFSGISGSKIDYIADESAASSLRLLRLTPGVVTDIRPASDGRMAARSPCGSDVQARDGPGAEARSARRRIGLHGNTVPVTSGEATQDSATRTVAACSGLAGQVKRAVRNTTAPAMETARQPHRSKTDGKQRVSALPSG